ncbi:MAG: hypothetical protein RLZZ305_1054 [Actinomycetota bacterium]|jgi:hypothetical protein
MTADEHISRDDLENKFRALQADILGRAEDRRQSLLTAGSIAAGLVVLLAYLLGRRSGRKRAGRVEFRRY